LTDFLNFGFSTICNVYHVVYFLSILPLPL
jgi:hypothetical protein